MNHIEVMAPAGNFAALTAAAQGGADAVYFGVGELNMRAHAANNFEIDDLTEISQFCKMHNMRSYLTLNTIIYDRDMEQMERILFKAKEATISAVIASDMAAIMAARRYGLEVHISTQLNISNLQSIKFFSQFADVMVLARELTLQQIQAISQGIQREQIKGPSGQLVKLELFCHGALCMAISGKCYLSLHHYHASANRGSCYQLCRRAYLVTDKETGAELEIDQEYIMSPKDLSTIRFLDKILNTGVEVLKIEGRARAPEYVKCVTSVYKRGVDACRRGDFDASLGEKLQAELECVFNRGFWDGYYQGAKMGEWSEVYGNKATQRKEYLGKVTNYFSKSCVAEILLETDALHTEERILIIGPTTGVVEQIVDEVRLDLEPISLAPKGSHCSVKTIEQVRRGDKVFRLIWNRA
ncbi:MAG: U32 family peptidase [Bacteroidales bacterium]|nr:U32 family peptidase [Bacteroidales bacterium]